MIGKPLVLMLMITLLTLLTLIVNPNFKIVQQPYDHRGGYADIDPSKCNITKEIYDNKGDKEKKLFNDNLKSCYNLGYLPEYAYKYPNSHWRFNCCKKRCDIEDKDLKNTDQNQYYVTIDSHKNSFPFPTKDQIIDKKPYTNLANGQNPIMKSCHRHDNRKLYLLMPWLWTKNTKSHPRSKVIKHKNVAVSHF